MKKFLVYIGNDSWNRPVYSDKNGVLWKDTSMGRDKFDNRYLCTAVSNRFNGEPLDPIKSTIEIIFIPKRINNWSTPAETPLSSDRNEKSFQEIEAEFKQMGIVRLGHFSSWDALDKETRRRFMIALMDSFDEYFSEDYNDTDVEE